MKSLVVYYSKYGNTRQIAESITSALEPYGSSQAVPLDGFSPTDLSDLDLVLMGCPTHVMNLPKAVRPLLKAMPKRSLRGTSAAVFDTSYKMSRWLEPFTAAKRLKSYINKLGGKPIARPETFHVMESEGPLYDGEIERAQTWAADLAQVVDGKLD